MKDERKAQTFKSPEGHGAGHKEGARYYLTGAQVKRQ
jgi:hypothetical protein